MTEYFAQDGHGNMLISDCCKDVMRLTPVTIESPNCPFPVTIPDNPLWSLQCTCCGEIAKPFVHPEPAPCEHCDPDHPGRSYNNGDPTSGQWVDCPHCTHEGGVK